MGYQSIVMRINRFHDGVAVQSICFQAFARIPITKWIDLAATIEQTYFKCLSVTCGKQFHFILVCFNGYKTGLTERGRQVPCFSGDHCHATYETLTKTFQVNQRQFHQNVFVHLRISRYNTNNACEPIPNESF